MSKRTITKYILSCLSIVFVACDPVAGDLIVQESFTVKKLIDSQCSDSGPSCWSQDDRAELETGGYSMKIDTESNKRLLIDISKKWDTKRIELILPDSKHLPANGELKLSAQESGQPFDFEIQMQTSVSNSEIQNSIESCSERVQTEVCFVVPGSSSAHSPVKKCEIKTIDAKGQKYVEFYYRTISEQAQALFLKEGTEHELAVYKGSRYSSDKIYTRVDRCELFRPYVYDNK